MPPIPIHKDAPIAPIPAKTDDSNSQNPPPTRTYVPATTTQDASGPPPPQPGARPIAPTSSTQQDYNNGSSPAPPQPGPTATFVTTETRQATGPPMQFTQPPPTGSALAGRSTTTSTTASKSGPTTLDMGPASTATGTSLEHPPGYVQAPDNGHYGVGGGLGGFGEQEGEDGGVGAAAWNILNKAGEALKKGEEAAWKAVRNK